MKIDILEKYIGAKLISILEFFYIFLKQISKIHWKRYYTFKTRCFIF